MVLGQEVQWPCWGTLQGRQCACVWGLLGLWSIGPLQLEHRWNLLKPNLYTGPDSWAGKDNDPIVTCVTVHFVTMGGHGVMLAGVSPGR